MAELQIDLRQSNTRWPLRTKLLRGLWNCVWMLLFRPTPKAIGNPWRLWLLRRFGASIEDRALVMGSCKILQPWKLKIGYGAAIGRESEIYNFAEVSIGRMSVVSQYSFLCTGTHDHTHPHFPLIWKPIHIGSECWIAAGSFVAPGVRIGDGAVIGARSVVTHDMPEWTICAGNPCRPIKPRTIAGAADAAR
jgi:putative colanic acid biosynthesis acetyltransferase WcaF